MTVAQLIGELQKYDLNLEVFIQHAGLDEGWEEAGDVCRVTMKKVAGILHCGDYHVIDTPEQKLQAIEWGYPVCDGLIIK